MKQIIYALAITFSFLNFTYYCSAQQTLIQVNSWNAYVHLPATYSNTTTSYPAIIYFPGLDKVGTDAQKVIDNGPGAYITQGWNGNIINNGVTTEFIVISLQPSAAYPTESLIQQRIQTLKSQYRIDTKRLFLTGFSQGGWCASTFVTGDPYGGPYTYASQVAAVVSVEGVRPDDNQPYPNLFDNFALSGGRYLGFEQVNDFRDIQTIVNRMNSKKANSGIFISTNFGTGGHCCPDNFYGGNGITPSTFSIEGVTQNIYQWLAKQTKGTTSNVAPVANAGADKIITLPTNSVSLSGSGTDADGTVTSYLWTKISGPAQGTITNASSPTATASSLVQGTYVFQLKVTDNSGATATDNMKVTVNAATQTNQPPTANAGADKTITLPTSSTTLTGSGTDADGTIASYAWSQVSGPSTATISNATAATCNVSNLAQGIYTFQLTVKDNKNATGSDQVNVTVNAATTTTAGTIKVNIYGGSNAYNNSEWNNWNTTGSLTSATFLYTDRTSSGISAILSGQAGVADNGGNYASGATVIPPAILRFNSYNTSNRVLTIRGLQSNKTYSINFYASRANTGNKTVVQYGTQHDTISTDNNVADFATLTNLTPVNGNLSIDLYRIGTYNYLAGFIITENNASRIAVLPEYAIAEKNDEGELNVYPNPFTDQLNILTGKELYGDLLISLKDFSGRTVLIKKVNKISPEMIIKISSLNIIPGYYILEIINGNKKYHNQLIKL